MKLIEATPEQILQLKKKLWYDEPTKEEKTDNINDVIDSLNNTPSEKGE